MNTGATGSIRALCNVRADSSRDGSYWVSEGDDPQLQINVMGQAEGDISGGWYTLVFRINAVDGRVASPCLYPDYGDGFSESTRIPLPDPDRDGFVRALVRLSYHVKVLRFDPTASSAVFSIRDLALYRVGKVRALACMADGPLGARGGPRFHEFGKIGFLMRVLFKALVSGPRRAGEWAYDTYTQDLYSRGGDYQAWIEKYDRVEMEPDLSRRVEDVVTGPLLSVLLPVYNTPEKWLRRCIDTVIQQTNPHWELCIADDSSPAPHVRAVLQDYQRRDARIKVVFRETNGHISESSNSALGLAVGEYVVLLDHDDELHPNALLEVAEAIRLNPSLKVIYSDEDKIDQEGRRFDPYFKPDWNYDLFLSHNCVSHLGVYNRALLLEVGGFSVGMEGSQDWDLALRCIERLKDEEIGHIPKVLYHWRAIPGSTALSPGEKNYAHLAAVRAIQSHLDRVGRNAHVQPLSDYPGNYRVVNKLPDRLPKVSLIVPTRDAAGLLKQCVSSILERTNYSNYEIVIVDNDSREEETFAYFKEVVRDSRVRVISYPKPFNYSAINNYAVHQSDGDIVGLINNDIEVISGNWLEEMVSQAIRPDIGAVGAMLYYPDDTIQHAGIILGFNGVAVCAYAGRPRGWVGQMLRGQLLQNMTAVTAACLLVRREVYDSVGGLDEKLEVAYNDVDFCLRVRQMGYRNIWTPYAELYHHESASRGGEDTEEKKARFRREISIMRERWGTLIANDPAYSPNLAITGETFDLAFPPREI